MSRAVVMILVLCCCCCAESPHKRQKRGIMKMMMHIMWDPVRLIRYWYAYDVTKEIAKSWRKIIPTVLLMPFSPHPFAKYVHPNAGLRTEPHKQPSSYLDAMPAHQMPVKVPLHDYGQANHFILQPYSSIHSSERKDPSHSPHLAPDWLRDLPFHMMQQQVEITEDSGAENAPKIHFKSPDDPVRNGGGVSKVIRPDQPEVHIVLHPIPVKDPERFRKSGYRIVPLQPNSPILPFSSLHHAQDHTPDVSDSHNSTSLVHSIANHNVSSSEMYSPPDDSNREEAASAPRPSMEEGPGDRRRGVRVNVSRLKEELKHGTPILIPYDSDHEKPLKKKKCEDDNGSGEVKKLLLLLAKKKDT